MEENKYVVRPAGRHILTIGSELIKDKYAAVVELVKNAYDADSPSVDIKFSTFKREEKKSIKIEISDRGHGMSFDDVINKWMVPSTDDKLKRKKSPKGRRLQGKKGIGRYAASILGDDLVLETVNEKGEFTELCLLWDEFKKARYLDDVEIVVVRTQTDKKNGTTLTITGSEEDYLEEWTEKQIQKLRFELKKLIPPVKTPEVEMEDFEITLEFENFPVEGYDKFKEKVEPYPLFELYDYKISGKVSKDGSARLTYHNQKIKNSIPEEIKFQILLNKDAQDEQTYCGEIILDFRVFDRETSSIDELIKRGLNDDTTGEYVGTREARNILNKFNGIGVYRHGFRIRPLGDPGFDWLELDKDRVQKPTQKIGSDQVIGFILIQPEDVSNLEEKSARDGLKENKNYYGLIEISKQVLLKLEERRYIYRKKAGLGRRPQKINEKIKKLFEFDDLKSGIAKVLDNFDVTKEDREKILKLVDNKAYEHNRIAQEIKDIVAIYQKHATVGKIVNVILHEGRHPLSYFQNQIPLLKQWGSNLIDNYDLELLEKLISRLDTVEENSQRFVNLFKKLDPLAARKRAKMKEFPLFNVIKDTTQIFESEFETQNIQIKIECEKGIKINGWKEDFITIFTNLIDNSIYWLNKIKKKNKEIKFSAYEEDGELIVEYRDNGPGIEKHLIESEVIFDPGFSTKTEGGTGIGLAIAGEAVDRNNGKLKAIYSQEGTYFMIEIERVHDE